MGKRIRLVMAVASLFVAFLITVALSGSDQSGKQNGLDSGSSAYADNAQDVAPHQNTGTERHCQDS